MRGPLDVAHAAGRVGCRGSRARSRRAWRRASSCTTFAGRTGTWRAGRRTTYRCRCISSPFCLCEGAPASARDVRSAASRAIGCTRAARIRSASPSCATARAVPSEPGAMTPKPVITARFRTRGKAGAPGVEPGPARLELAMLAVTPRACENRTARLERATPGWRSAARRRSSPELRAFVERASGRSRTCTATVRRVRAALDTTEA